MRRRDDRRGGWAAARLLATAGAVLAISSCGGDPSAAIETTVERAIAAFEQRDAQALCATLSNEGKLVTARSAHREPPFDCPDEVNGYLDWIEPYRGGARPRVDGVTTDGDGGATARVALPGGARVTLPLSETDGQWRLDGLFDARLGYVQAGHAPGGRELLDVLEQPPGPVAGDSVTVRDASAAGRPPCPETRTGDYPYLTSGCVLELAGEDLDLTVWTPFGVVPFADCDVSYRLRVDGTGRAWVTDFLVEGVSPCPDVVACRARSLQIVPWRATLDRREDGRILLRVDDACLDTCIGLVEGSWEVELVEGRRRWRATFASRLGTSGWQIDGPLRSRGKTIAIEG